MLMDVHDSIGDCLEARRIASGVQCRYGKQGSQSMSVPHHWM